MNWITMESACYISALVIEGKRFWIPTLAGKRLGAPLNHYLNSVDYALLTSEQACQLTGDSDSLTALTCLLSKNHRATIILFTDAFLICRSTNGWIYRRSPRVSRRAFASTMARQLTTSQHFDVVFQTTATAMEKTNDRVTQLHRRDDHANRAGVKARRFGTVTAFALSAASCVLPLFVFSFAV